MSALKAPFGFKPLRSLVGNFNPATRRYFLEGTGGRGAFSGDVVTHTSGNNVSVIATSANNVQTVLGVISQVLDTNQKPLVFSLPLRGPFLPGSTNGFADVFIDPSNTYWVATDATAPNTIVDAFVQVTAASSGAANNAVGRSSFAIAITGASAATKSLTHSWRVLGPAPEQRDYLVNADWTEGVEVVLARTIQDVT
jgi:hypothetical protein